jgi:biotin transport system substrate-specific component
MSAVVPAAPRLVLVDRVFSRTWVLDIVLVTAGAALTALLAHVRIELYPVPITGQTLAVLLIGASLGAARGASALGLYAVLGLVGLPVFAPEDDGSHVVGFEALTSSSFGYIIGFILSAAFVGWLAQRQWDRKFLRALLTFVGGTIVTFLIGLPWLAVWFSIQGPAVWQDYLGYDSVLAATIGAGLLPFIIGGVVKALIAAGLLPLAWLGAAKLAKRRENDPQAG